MKRRLYRSGSRWAFWRWTITDSTYITRLHVLKTPWFAVCLHWLNKADPEPYMHDHPVTFLSLILRGWYTEGRRNRSTGWRIAIRTHRFYNWIRATDQDTHTIIDVAPRTLTLCLMGPKTRDWGFHKMTGSELGREWIHWKVYYAAKRQGVQL